MQKLLEMRLVSKFLQGTPILFASFVAEFFADRSEIQTMLLLNANLIVIVVVVMLMGCGICWLRPLQDAKFIFVRLIVHIVR